MSKPLVISIVSGKGGVGKTRISISLAKILSKYLKVLLIDFDLHNQGLTHLLDDRKKNINESSTFDYLCNKNYVKPTKLQENLFFISASKDTIQSSQKEIEDLNYNYTSQDFKSILLELIDDAQRAQAALLEGSKRDFDENKYNLYFVPSCREKFSKGRWWLCKDDRQWVVSEYFKIFWFLLYSYFPFLSST